MDNSSIVGEKLRLPFKMTFPLYGIRSATEPSTLSWGYARIHRMGISTIPANVGWMALNFTRGGGSRTKHGRRQHEPQNFMDILGTCRIGHWHDNLLKATPTHATPHILHYRTGSEVALDPLRSADSRDDEDSFSPESGCVK